MHKITLSIVVLLLFVSGKCSRVDDSTAIPAESIQITVERAKQILADTANADIMLYHQFQMLFDKNGYVTVVNQKDSMYKNFSVPLYFHRLIVLPVRERKLIDFTVIKYDPSVLNTDSLYESNYIMYKNCTKFDLSGIPIANKIYKNKSQRKTAIKDTTWFVYSMKIMENL